MKLSGVKNMPFMLIDLQLHEGKTFYVVTGSVIDLEFPEINNRPLSKPFSI